ncbi:N-acetyltransferase [Bacillus amyloliquefaciens]|uniref:N-acetyltransferase n=1 Tax=Bacillus amyloliquefaciens TaxID=1390 RepID=UPI002E0134A4|nr:N-acetyltransferase [Bacillus amyloliquefaciens]MEC5258167.1 N-acetyltransferase [Bacillus amyloliquefaciens]
MLKIERLLINFKTLEEFKRFKEYGMQELSMLEDLQDNIIENDSTSPFYGIYFGDKLVARMSLYQVNGSANPYFDQRQDFLELWKLEVLPGYQNNGYGKALVDFAKSFRMPIRTNSRMKSAEFWNKMNFEPVKYDMSRDKGENPYIWHPDMDGEMTSGETA